MSQTPEEFIGRVQALVEDPAIKPWIKPGPRTVQMVTITYAEGDSETFEGHGARTVVDTSVRADGEVPAEQVRWINITLRVPADPR